MNELVTTFKDSLFNTSLADVAKEIIENGVDFVLDNGVLKEIPIVNLVVGVGQVAFRIRDYIFLKQTMSFFAHLHDGSITTQQFEKYKKELEEDPQKAEKELSRVIVLLDRIIDDQKNKILASFYGAFIENRIAWDKFHELSEALDRLFITDVQMLYRINDSGSKILYKEGGYIADRLVSVGLVINPTSRVQIPAVGGLPSFGIIPLSLTDLGILFIQLSKS